MKYLIFLITALFLLGGCSAKEINEGFDGMRHDVSKAFEDSRDKSAD